MRYEPMDESTVDLWNDGSIVKISLKNIQTGKQQNFVLKKSFVIGRNKQLCNLQISVEDRYISGRHLQFLNRDGMVYVEDLKSKNGTKINGRPVFAPTRVRTGDLLKMGRTEFRIILLTI